MPHSQAQLGRNNRLSQAARGSLESQTEWGPLASTSSSIHPISVVQRFMDGVEQRMIAGRDDSAEADRFQFLFEQALWSPDLEVFTRGDRVVVRAALPELEPHSLRVHLEDGVLCITGARRSVDGDLSLDGHQVDGYVRRLTLPMNVQEADTSTAVLGDTLEISLPAN